MYVINPWEFNCKIEVPSFLLAPTTIHHAYSPPPFILLGFAPTAAPGRGQRPDTGRLWRAQCRPAKTRRGAAPQVPVGVVTATPAEVGLLTELPGRVEASRFAEIRARSAGICKALVH